MVKIAEIRSALYRLADADYKKFNCSLIPNVDKSTVVGVRIPALRKLAAEINKAGLATAFMAELPHRLYEENHLHSFLIEKIGDFDECICEIERFLPFVDNWAVCDSMSPKVLARQPERLLEKVRQWLESPHEYTVRFALKMLMTHFLDEHFLPEHLKLAVAVAREEYYVKMMVAWYFATALAKQLLKQTKILLTEIFPSC